jgi:hypothetical protein
VPAGDEPELISRLVDVVFVVPRTLSAPIGRLRRFVDRQEARAHQELRNAYVVGALSVGVGRRRLQRPPTRPPAKE